MEILQKLLTLSILTMLLACSGGGGDEGGAAPTGNAPAGGVATGLAEALAFDEPFRFLNGESYITVATTIQIKGELNTVTVPRGYCPDKTPPRDYSVQWTNRATGQTGRAPIGIGCVSNTLFGIPLEGVASAFRIYDLNLALGANEIWFETYRGSTRIGEDQILVIREDRTSPTVRFHYPPEDASGIPINHAVLVQFDEPMNESTLTADQVELVDDLGNPVPGDYQYDRASYALMIRPDAGFSPLSSYEVRVTTSVSDTGGDNGLQAELAWSFQTGVADDTTPIELQARWPGSACDCAPTGTRVLVQFVEVSDPASISDNSVVVTDASNVRLDGDVRQHGDFVEFNPDQPLAPGQTYTVKIVAGIKDLAGQALTADVGWQFTTSDQAPAGTWHAMGNVEEQVEAMSHLTATWSGTEALFWGWHGGGRYDPVTNSWQSISKVNAPLERTLHSAVWTGAELIVWGGQNQDGTFNDGGIFDPVNDLWQPIASPLPASVGGSSRHVAAWTGDELIVWGGVTKAGSDSSGVLSNRGFRFNPVTDSWDELADAPLSPRQDAVFAWTGAELVIWGGYTLEGEPVTDGARYDPVTDTWALVSTIDSPGSSTAGIKAVWTGTELMVWNGGRNDPAQVINNRFRQVTMRFYDPLTDTWRQPDNGWEPFVATGDGTYLTSGFGAFWTGSEVFVLGKRSRDGGWLFDPVTESWRPTSVENAPFFLDGSAGLWTSDRYLEWGGAISVFPSDDGKYYLPE